MEYLEHLLKLSRQAEEQAQELRDTIGKILDVPVRGAARSVQNELLRAGFTGGDSSTMGRRIISQRQLLLQKIVDTQCEIEVLTSIADDLIGQNGRLV